MEEVCIWAPTLGSQSVSHWMWNLPEQQIQAVRINNHLSSTHVVPVHLRLYFRAKVQRNPKVC